MTTDSNVIYLVSWGSVFLFDYQSRNVIDYFQNTKLNQFLATFVTQRTPNTQLQNKNFYLTTPNYR